MAPALRRASRASFCSVRNGRRVAAALVTAACFGFGPALAQSASDDDAADDSAAAPPTLGWRWEASPSAWLRAAPFDSRRAELGAAPAIDYRLWVGNRQTEVGLGIGSPSSVVLALRYQVSERSRLTFDTPIGGAGDSLTGRARRHPFGVELESSALHGLTKGTLLRAQLNASSSLALRLRGGRLGLYLQMRITGRD